MWELEIQTFSKQLFLLARRASLRLILRSDFFLTDSLLPKLRRPSFPAEIIKISSHSQFHPKLVNKLQKNAAGFQVGRGVNGMMGKTRWEGKLLSSVIQD